MRGASIVFAFCAALLAAPAARGQAFRLGPGAQISPTAVLPTTLSGRGTIWINSTDSNRLYYTNPAGTNFKLSLLSGLGTTKGDIIVYDGTTYVRLGAGANNSILTADSTQASGLRWGSALVATKVTSPHYAGNGSTPAVAVGAGAGVGASALITGTDAAMEVNLTLGAGPGAGTMFTVTFASAYAANPYCTLTPSTSAAASADWDWYVDRAAGSTTTVLVKSSGFDADASGKVILTCIE